MRPLRRGARITAGLVLLVISMAACRTATAPPSGRAAVAAAIGDTLPFRARLSGGFAPSKQGPTRAAGDRALELSPDARIALAMLEKRAKDNPTPAALADLGLAQLIQGDIDRAITTIADAASQDSKPAPWSDLSAAYLAKAERTPQRRVEYLALALEAAEQSLKISKTNDALFNRALAREGLAPYTGAPAPWSEFTSSETDTAWRDAAKTAQANRAVDDASDQWEARRKELVARLKAHDVVFVTDTVRQYPEASLEFLDRELLTAGNSLSEAELLAHAIQEITGDVMSRDAVAIVRNNSATLTTAHQLYVKGLSQFDASDFDGSRKQLLRALDLFARAGSPYREWCALWIAINDSKGGKFEPAQISMARVEQEARRRHYTTLLARTLLQRGLVYNRQWKLTEGLAAFRESASLYTSSAQHENAVSLYSNLADALRMLGEPQESWDYIGRTLDEIPRLHKPLRRYLILYNAALFAGRQEMQESAALFQDAAVREASRVDARVVTEAMIHRALINIRRGELTKATADLDHADAQLVSAAHGPFRTYMTAELEIARAQLPGRGDVAKLNDAITFFSKAEPGRMPGLYLLLARTPHASPMTVENALKSGIENLESQQAGLGDERFRISYFDESWSLFGDMVAFQVAANDAEKAFEYAERSRARSLLATAQGTATSQTRLLPDIQSRLPASMVMLHYTTLPDRVLIWRISSAGATLTERRIAERELARLIGQHRAAIREHREDHQVNDRLYSLLIPSDTSSIANDLTIALVPDAQLQQLSFATLKQPKSGRYLIEDHPLIVSPSATFFVDARAAAIARSKGAVQSALLIGNPAASGERELPGAEAEVEASARYYPTHDVLIGQRATKARFLSDAAAFDVIHFGGHALVNPEFPLLSRLVFADDAGSEQSLFAHEISRMRFPRTRVVVLAACSTGAGIASRGEGAVNIARPFLGDGVPLVVASQWDVDDRATQQLVLVFHRELAKSGNPVAALRTAQLTLLRSGDVNQVLPDRWGAFVAVGTTAQ
jgi:CHAT domain-containing protein